MVKAYDPTIAAELLPQEHAQFEAACMAMWSDALASDNSDRLVELFADERMTKTRPPRDSLSPKQLNRYWASKKRAEAYLTFHEALSQDDDDMIVTNYRADVLEGCSLITSKDRERYDLARRRSVALTRLRDAMLTGDDQAIVDAYDPILDKPYRDITEPEREHLARARKRVEAAHAIEEALGQDDDASIVAAYDKFRDVLEGDDGLFADREIFTREDKRRLQKAQRRRDTLTQLVDAIDKGDDDAINEAHNALRDDSPTRDIEAYLKNALGNRFPAFARHRFRQALKSDDADEIVRNYDPVLDNDATLSDNDRRKYEEARRWLELRADFERSLDSSDDRAVFEAAERIEQAGMTLRFAAYLTDPQKRERLDYARDWVPWQSSLHAATSRDEEDPGDDFELVHKCTPRLLEAPRCTLDPSQGKRLYRAYLRMAALWYIKSIRQGGRDEELERSFRVLLADFPPVRDGLPPAPPLALVHVGWWARLKARLGMA